MEQMNGDANSGEAPIDNLWAQGMGGAVAALALGLARESERSEPAWARAWLNASDPEPTIKQILKHRIADIALPILVINDDFAPAAAALAADVRRTRLQSMTLVAGLRTAAESLDAANVRYLLVKGPALAAQTTGDWTARRSVDLDLLVDIRDVPRTAQALEVAGFAKRSDFAPGPGSPLFAPTSKWLQELAFSSPSHTVDLHWRLDPSRGCLTWEFRQLWERHVDVDVGGTDVATLSPVDAALFNAVHAGKDCWSSLHQLRDHVRLAKVARLSDHEWQLAARDASCRIRWEVAQEMCRPLWPTGQNAANSAWGGARRAKLLARRMWLWLASGTSPASGGSAGTQWRYLAANVAGYDTVRAATQRLGVVVWPVQEMAAQTLGGQGNRHPWLYPATAPVHIPRRMVRKSRLVAPSRVGEDE